MDEKEIEEFVSEALPLFGTVNAIHKLRKWLQIHHGIVHETNALIAPYYNE